MDEGYRSHKRDVAIRNLGVRTHLTLEKLAKLVGHKEHGETVKDITLQELIDVQINSLRSQTSTKKTGTKSSNGVSAKKVKTTTTTTPPKMAAKKATKKTTKAAKMAAKKTTKATKGASTKGPKADKGKPKPRLDYETGMREVLAAVKAAGDPVGRGEIEEATGYSGVQVRTFAKKLAAAGKIKVLGKGGRSTRYDVS